VKIQNEDFISDDLNKKIALSNTPKRIITLAPNLTELVFELGEGRRIVGNTSFCNFPDSAKNIPNVADLLTVNLEKVTSLKPDLIFISAEGNSKSEYNKLIELGFNVFVSNPRHYNGIKKTLLDMGKIFNVYSKAESIIQNWDSRLKKITDDNEKVVFNTVIFIISTNPIISVGRKSFIHQILTYAGLKNITSGTDISYPIFSREEVLLKNPDYILLYETNNNEIGNILDLYPEWHTLSAVINNRVLFINADKYSRPGPRFINAVEDLHYRIISK
jgi:iron complex transport system substrate-binding protein